MIVEQKMFHGRILIAFNLFPSECQNVLVFTHSDLKVGLSPSKKIFLVCFNESPFKMMKNFFYFILKTFFVVKIFTFLS